MKQRTSIIPVLISLTALFMLIGGCQPVDLFTAYDGVNLIANYQFGEVASDLDGWAPVDSTLFSGAWSASSAYPSPNPADAGTTANEYLNFTPLNGVSTPTLSQALAYSGLPATTASGDQTQVYRLELINQFRNGDFQTSTVGAGALVTDIDATGWSSSGGTINIVSSTVNGTAVKSLAFDSLGGNNLVGDLSNLISNNSWTNGTQFIMHMDFTVTSSQPSLFFIEDAALGFADALTGEYRYTIPNNIAATSASLPGTINTLSENIFMKVLDGNTYDSLYFGFFNSSPTEKFDSQIDNIRMVRADDGISYAIRLQIPVSESGRPDLIEGGYYTFSVYLAADPTVPALDNGTADVNNRFAAEYVTLWIGQTGSYGNGNSGQYYTAQVPQTPGSWEQISFTSQAILNNVPANSNPDILELRIIPSAYNYDSNSSVYDLAPGSLLIALPELSFSPE